jgi:hypothetical protein
MAIETKMLMVAIGELIRKASSVEEAYESV